MALANKCDRCGAYYTETRNSELKLIKSKGVHFSSGHKLDLCDKCQEALEDFMNTDYTFDEKLKEFDEKHFGGPLEKENENV